jgi:hypothetical protein
MAEPNLLAPSSIKGMTAFIRQTSERILVLDNPIGSGKVFKINSLSKFPAQINLGGNSNFFIVNTEFPIDAKFKYDQHINADGNAGVNRWTVINKNEMLYLTEGTAIWSNDNGAGSTNPVDITISYEEIS